MYKAKIQGVSMFPTFSDGEIVYFHKVKKYRKGDIVIAKYKGHLIVKRIKKIKDGIATLIGDNKKVSIIAEVPVENIKAKYFSAGNFNSLSNAIYKKLLKRWG